MKDKPAWLRSWEIEDDRGELRIVQADDEDRIHVTWHIPSMSDENLRLACEAPAMVRLLLQCEWKACEHVDYDSWHDSCPICGAWNRGYARDYVPQHMPGCKLDQALYNVGLQTQGSREEARKALGIT